MNEFIQVGKETHYVTEAGAKLAIIEKVKTKFKIQVKNKDGKFVFIKNSFALKMDAKKHVEKLNSNKKLLH